MISKSIKDMLKKGRNSDKPTKDELRHVRELNGEEISPADLRRNPDIMEELFPGRSYNSVRYLFYKAKG